MYINLITIDLCPGQGGGGVDPSGTLGITSNGMYNVYSYASASVSVHPSTSLSETYTTNGIKTITGEFNGGSVNVDVHPSTSLSETYTSNGSYNITGEFNGGLITIDVPAPQFITETLSVSVNNTYYPGSGVNGFSQVVVNVPQSVTGFTEKEVTEGKVNVTSLNNSASYVNERAFYGNSYLSTVNLPYCKYVGSSAFRDCSKMTELSLPICSIIYSEGCRYVKISYLDLPETIHLFNSAFYACYSLESVSLPKCYFIDNDAFNEATRMTDIYIPKVYSIGQYAFVRCSSLTNMDLSYTVYVGTGAFQGCRSLQVVNLPKCYEVGTSVFGNCIALTSISLPKVMRIGGLAFENCSNVSEFIFPNLISVGGATFNLCSNGNISVVSLPNLLSISKWFGNPILLNTSLSDLYIGTDVYGVLDYASVISGTNTTITGSIYVNGYEYNNYITANGWSSISSMLVPVGDTSVPMLFRSDSMLCGDTGAITSLWSSYVTGFPSNEVTEISLPKCRCIYFNTFQGYRNLTSVNLPSCEYIDMSAFQSCGVLSNINLPNCEYIGSSAFRNCPLTEIDLPNCEFIDVGAFSECKVLSSISLPKCKILKDGAFQGVGQSCSEEFSINLPVCEYIGSSAFYWATKMNAITLGSDKVCTLMNTEAFYATKILQNGSIYVPASLVDAYKSADIWSLISSRIFPISE